MKKTSLSPGERFGHLTLTLKNQSNLKSMCTELVQSFKKLRNRKIWKRHFQGGAFVIEITGSPDNWHAHLHVAYQGKYCLQAELLKSWRSLVGKGGVFIKVIPKSALIHYLTKYLTKQEVEPAYKDDVNEALRDFRLFQPFGIWHKLIGSYKKNSFPCPSCGCKVWIIDFMLSSHYMEKNGKFLEHDT